jgi:4a-hydroxytetrahydrobiopterin dehydratase
MGARNPFPAEIESNFADKTLGNTDTLHRILIPTDDVAAGRWHVGSEQDPVPLSVDDARRLLHRVVGWRLLLDENEEKPARLQVRDEACGQDQRRARRRRPPAGRARIEGAQPGEDGALHALRRRGLTVN